MMSGNIDILHFSIVMTILVLSCFNNSKFAFTVCFRLNIMLEGRHGGLMVSALVPGVSGPGSSPGRGHCAVFLDKTRSHNRGRRP